MRLKRFLQWGYRIGAMLLCLMSLTACFGQSAARQTVTVMLTGNAIQSSLTAFDINAAYEFVVTNKGPDVSEFLIMPPLSYTQHLAESQLGTVSLASLLSIASGATKTLDFTFTHSAVMHYSTGMDMRGFEFASHLPGQYEAGMRLSISLVPGQ